MIEEKTESLTLIFVDIPALGAIREREGEPVARECLQHCNTMVSEILATHGGILVRSVGGTILCSFANADDAIDASVLIQRRVSGARFSSSERPVLRMGMHAGTVVVKDGSCTGEVVTTAARLVTMAKPGQILAAESVFLLTSEHVRGHLRPLPGGGDLEQRLNSGLYVVPWQASSAGQDEGGGEEGAEAEAEGDDPVGLSMPAAKRRTHVVKVMSPPVSAAAADSDLQLADEDISVRSSMKRKTTQHERPLREVTCSADRAEQAVRRRRIILREVEEQRAKTEGPGGEGSSSGVGHGARARLCLIWHENVLVVDVSRPSLTLGRDASNDIVLDVVTASRRHAEICLRGGRYYLIDRSSNGTFVYDEAGNEHYIEHAEMALSTCGAICPGCPQEESGSEALLYWLAGG